MKVELSDFQRWVKANEGQKFTLFDYIHAMNIEEQFGIDLFYAISKLIWPEFYELNGYLYLKEEFDNLRYQELKQQLSSESEVGYWMNMLNLDGMLPTQTEKFYSYLGELLKTTWEAKLSNEYPDSDYVVEYIKNDEDEFFITFHKKG